MFTIASRQVRWEPSKYLSGKVAGWMCGLTLSVSKEKLGAGSLYLFIPCLAKDKSHSDAHSWLNFNVFFVAVNVVYVCSCHSSKTSIATARPFDGTKNRCKVIYMV